MTNFEIMFKSRQQSDWQRERLVQIWIFAFFLMGDKTVDLLDNHLLLKSTHLNAPDSSH